MISISLQDDEIDPEIDSESESEPEVVQKKSSKKKTVEPPKKKPVFAIEFDNGDVIYFILHILCCKLTCVFVFSSTTETTHEQLTKEVRTNLRRESNQMMARKVRRRRKRTMTTSASW